jgi:hypothetical protein
MPSPKLPVETIPPRNAHLVPPFIHGVAALARRAAAGDGLDDLLAAIRRPITCAAEEAAQALDIAFALQLRFRRNQGLAMQAHALELQKLFRMPTKGGRPLRLLALVAPGDLMVNTPLDFLTRQLDVALDLLFLLPNEPLPPALPEHDVAFFAVSESDPAALRRLAPLYANWPKPALNNPARIADLSRDELPALLAGIPGLHCPRARRCDRDELALIIEAVDAPVLVRPLGSHAGAGLALLHHAAELDSYLPGTDAERFFVTPFVDYRSPDGLFRKSRVAMIDGAPFLCHLAVSEHWMVHYLNANMEHDAGRRAEEAAAFASFDDDFAQRHGAALAALDQRLGLDYYQLDCAETPDGRLLVFEADVSAIVHDLDPPDIFPYKGPQMRRIFAAFGAMLACRAASRTGHTAAMPALQLVQCQ